MSAVNSVPLPPGPADDSKPPGKSVQGEAANRSSDHPYISIIDEQFSTHVQKGAADRTSDHPYISIIDDQDSKHVQNGTADRTSDPPYITILESDGQGLNHKQKGKLSYENVVRAGQYENVNDVGDNPDSADTRLNDETKQGTKGYSYVNTVGKPNIQVKPKGEHEYVYTKAPAAAAAHIGITNDEIRGNGVMVGGNDVMGGDNDVIMEDNDVYQGGARKMEERSVYALAKETEDITPGYDADNEGMIIEENVAYEGSGHTTKNEDKMIFEENDAYEGAGHTAKNEDEMIFEENDAYEGAGHTTKNEDEVIFEENDAYEGSPAAKDTK